MRLIDANRLIESMRSRYERLEGMFGEEEMASYKGAMVDALLDIESAPTVREFPILRCKDCKHLSALERHTDSKFLFCAHRFILNEVSPYDFCSHGERKTSDE